MKTCKIYRKKSLAENLIYFSFGVSILGLIMPWTDLGFVTRSGFTQMGWLLYVLTIWPFLHFYLGKKINPGWAIIGQVIAIIILHYYWSTMVVELMGKTINVFGWGGYLFGIHIVINIVALFVLNFQKKIMKKHTIKWKRRSHPLASFFKRRAGKAPLLSVPQFQWNNDGWSICSPCEVTHGKFELTDGVAFWRFSSLDEAKKKREELIKNK